MGTPKLPGRKTFAATLFITAATMLSVASDAAKEAPSTAPKRAFYLTKGTFDGSQPLTACAAGYHMASLWEIHEPSSLRYEESLGFTHGDGGPPTEVRGWIRLGLEKETHAYSFFCSDPYSPPWSYNSSDLRGATAQMVFPFFELQDFTVIDRTWGVIRNSCDTLERVWCVQD